MKAINFLYHFNYRLIAIHTLATFFFLLAANNLSALYDIGILEALYKYGSHDFYKHLELNSNETIGQRFTEFLYVNFAFGFIALVISFFISLRFSMRNNIFWMNSLAVFLVSFLIKRFGTLNHRIISYITKVLRSYFVSDAAKYSIIIIGIGFTIIGLILYFNKWTQRWILNGKMKISNNK